MTGSWKSRAVTGRSARSSRFSSCGPDHRGHRSWLRALAAHASRDSRRCGDPCAPPEALESRLGGSAEAAFAPGTSARSGKRCDHGARLERCVARHLLAVCLPICAGAIALLASPGAAPPPTLKPSLADIESSGDPATISSNRSVKVSNLTFSNSLEIR